MKKYLSLLLLSVLMATVASAATRYLNVYTLDVGRLDKGVAVSEYGKTDANDYRVYYLASQAKKKVPANVKIAPIKDAMISTAGYSRSTNAGGNFLYYTQRDKLMFTVNKKGYEPVSFSVDFSGKDANWAGTIVFLKKK
ncbi:MAG: hypothetical protein WC405_20250 [Syntrophales bacterium]